MQMLRMISGLVFLIRPLHALSRLLARPFAATVRYIRPTTALTRACYVGLGIILLLGALGAEQDGQRNYAIALAVAGAVLLILRRIVTNIQDEPKQSVPFQKQPIQNSGPQMPSDLLRAGWTRKGVAINGRGESALSDDPAAVAWSLCGAVNAVYEADSALWKSYMVALQAQVGHNLVRWNGDSNRTQEDVVAVALEAEKKANGRIGDKMKAADAGRRIVESNGGKTGEALVVAILARTDPALAGRYVGRGIVDEHGGKTGQALVEEMMRCA